MGLKERMGKIMNELYTEKMEGDIITKEELIVMIQDIFDITGPTAKKYIKDLERRDLLNKQSPMTYRVKDKDKIDDKWFYEGSEEE